MTRLIGKCVTLHWHRPFVTSMGNFNWGPISRVVEIGFIRKALGLFLSISVYKFILYKGGNKAG